MNIIEAISAKNNRQRVFRSALVFASALSISSCAINKDSTDVSASAEATLSSTYPLNQPQLIFDALQGSGSSIIQVYPGAGESATDKQANGTFNDGDIVVALCKTHGRTVISAETRGEEKRMSSEWIKIMGTPDEEQYATSVYIEDPASLLKKLPEC